MPEVPIDPKRFVSVAYSGTVLSITTVPYVKQARSAVPVDVFEVDLLTTDNRDAVIVALGGTKPAGEDEE